MRIRSSSLRHAAARVRALAPCCVLAAALQAAPATAGGLDVNPSAVAHLPAAAWHDPHLGVILVATAAAGPCVGGGLWMHVFDLARKDDAPDVPFVPVDLLAKSDFSGHYGSLSAMALPPGHYAMVLSYTSPYLDTPNPLAYRFDVTAGEVEYLGRLRKHGDCDANAPDFDVADRHEFDINEAAGRATDPKAAARAVTHLMRPV